MGACLESLPVELRLQVLQHLDPRSVARVEAVSRRWKQDAEDHWDHVARGILHRATSSRADLRNAMCERQLMMETLVPPSLRGIKRLARLHRLPQIAVDYADKDPRTSLVAYHCMREAHREEWRNPVLVRCLEKTQQSTALAELGLQTSEPEHDNAPPVFDGLLGTSVETWKLLIRHQATAQMTHLLRQHDKALVEQMVGNALQNILMYGVQRDVVSRPMVETLVAWLNAMQLNGVFAEFGASFAEKIAQYAYARGPGLASLLTHLIEIGATNKPPLDGCIKVAFVYRDDALLKALIRQGLNLNGEVVWFYERRNLLCLAVEEFDAEVVELLLRNGANPEVEIYQNTCTDPLEHTRGHGKTWALLHAISEARDALHRGKLKDIYRLRRIVGVLLHYGASTHRATKPWPLLVELAAEDSPSSREIMRWLLEYGLDPNVPTQDGYTPLHYAKSQEARNILISHGANPLALSYDWEPAVWTHRMDARLPRPL